MRVDRLSVSFVKIAFSKGITKKKKKKKENDLMGVVS